MNSKKKIDQAEADASAFFDLTNRSDKPIFETTLRAHRSLPRSGFVWLISIVSVLFLVPLFAFIGSLVLWGILLPILVTICALWYSFDRNYKDGTVHENIKVWHDLMCVERVNPRRTNQYWQANPHWVKTGMRDRKELTNYLTLSGGHREIEIGSFLTPEQRLDIRFEIEKAIRQAKSTGV